MEVLFPKASPRLVPFLSSRLRTGEALGQSRSDLVACEAAIDVWACVFQQYEGFHKWEYPNSWMVDKETLYSKWWSGGTPNSGNLYANHGKIAWFLEVGTPRWVTKTYLFTDDDGHVWSLRLEELLLQVVVVYPLIIPLFTWLVVWTLLKNMKVHWDDYSQYMGQCQKWQPNHQPANSDRCRISATHSSCAWMLDTTSVHSRLGLTKIWSAQVISPVNGWRALW